jgi:uncharacterized membrane protein YgdD (TMEM256/DUF423 family)
MDQSSIILWALGYAFFSGVFTAIGFIGKGSRIFNMFCALGGSYLVTSVMIMMELFP